MVEKMIPESLPRDYSGHIVSGANKDRVGITHTHPSGIENNFSSVDMWIADNFGLVMYVATSARGFLKYKPYGQEIQIR